MFFGGTIGGRGLACSAIQSINCSSFSIIGNYEFAYILLSTPVISIPIVVGVKSIIVKPHVVTNTKLKSTRKELIKEMQEIKCRSESRLDHCCGIFRRVDF